MARFSELSSVYVPLHMPKSFENLDFSVDKPYHWTSILASAIETVTLPTRFDKTNLESVNWIYTNCAILSIAVDQLQFQVYLRLYRFLFQVKTGKKYSCQLTMNLIGL